MKSICQLRDDNVYDQNQHWGTRVMTPTVSVSVVTWFPNVGSNMYEVLSFLFGALLLGSKMRMEVQICQTFLSQLLDSA